MKILRLFGRLLPVASFCLLSSTANAALYAFGDSLSDAGNTSLATGGALPGAGYYNGRYSNGPVWVELLAGRLGLAVPQPSLVGGTDYAWAGAFSATGGQVPTILSQVSGFTASKTFLPTDIITLWGGANDLILGTETNPLVPAASIVSNVTALVGAGAKLIIVPNLPDLGDTPSLAAQGAAAQAGASLWTQGFNAYLSSTLPALAAGNNVQIQLLDVYSLSKELRNNPATYGFTNTTDSALLTNNVALAGQYLYWDTVHPTAAVHQLIANAAIPEPGSVMFLFLTGLSVALRRRRAA